MTGRVEPKTLGDLDVFEVSDDRGYLGLFHELDGGRWRAYGSRVGVDNQIVSTPTEFATRAEAEAWLLDGAES